MMSATPWCLFRIGIGIRVLLLTEAFPYLDRVKIGQWENPGQLSELVVFKRYLNAPGQWHVWPLSSYLLCLNGLIRPLI
jgi:hypothetical protein